MSKKHTFDVCIIGAGMVGLFAAITFAKKGLSVALCDASNLQDLNTNNENPLDARSLALSLSSQKILQSFDCWDEIQQHSQAITDIQVSSQGHWGVTRLNNQLQGCEALGYVIESHLLNAFLLQTISKLNAITIFQDSQCDNIEHLENGSVNSFSQSDKSLQINASLTLICDGAASKTRELAGFKTTHSDYGQMAIAANISGEDTHNSIAFERFTAEGPMAMLPLTEKRYGLVWTNSITRSETLMQMTDAEFLTELQQHFGYRLGHLKQLGNRACFPLHKVISQSLVHHRCVVLGNAAHNLHPVAGQSLNLALRDIAHLYDFIDAIKQCDDSLQQYELLRQKDHQQVIQLSDTLVHLFSNNLPLLNHARSAALALLDVIPPLKNDFAWRGMGFAQSAASSQSGKTL